MPFDRSDFDGVIQAQMDFTRRLAHLRLVKKRATGRPGRLERVFWGLKKNSSSLFSKRLTKLQNGCLLVFPQKNFTKPSSSPGYMGYPRVAKAKPSTCNALPRTSATNTPFASLRRWSVGKRLVGGGWLFGVIGGF